MSAAAVGDSTIFAGSSFGEWSSLSAADTSGKVQYIIPMPEGNHRRKIRQRAIPTHRWKKISDRRMYPAMRRLRV